MSIFRTLFVYALFVLTAMLLEYFGLNPLYLALYFIADLGSWVYKVDQRSTT